LDVFAASCSLCDHHHCRCVEEPTLKCEFGSGYYRIATPKGLGLSSWARRSLAVCLAVEPGEASLRAEQQTSRSS
jgi:hypothetical protein